MTCASIVLINSSYPCGSAPPASKKSNTPFFRAMNPSTLIPTNTDTSMASSQSRGLQASLPSGFVQDNAGGDSGVKRFNGASLRDRQRGVHFGDNIPGQACTFIADKQRGGFAETSLVERGTFVRGRGKKLHPPLAQMRNQFRQFRRHYGQSKNRPSRSATRFRVVRADSALRQNHSASPKCFSRPQDGPKISRILHTGRDNQQSRLLPQGLIQRKFLAANQGSHTLRRIRRNRLVEELSGYQIGLDLMSDLFKQPFLQALGSSIASIGKEDGAEPDAAADGFLKRTETLNGKTTVVG